MMRAAFSAAHVFAWIGVFAYLAVQKNSLTLGISAVALLYALQHVVVILLTPYAAKYLAHGMRNQMTLGALAASAAFATLGIGFQAGEAALAPAVCAFALFLGVYRALYFTPYALLSHASKRVAFLEILIVLLPALTGALLLQRILIPSVLFFGASIVLALSVIPIFWIREKHEGFSWGYRESFHQLFDPRHRRLFLTSFFDGVEAAALLLLWPIVVWIAVGGSLWVLGLVLSITLLLSLLLQALFRRFAYKPSPAHEALMRASVWVLRSVAGTAGAIVLVDLYGSASASAHARGIDPASLEQAADSHTYVDEYSVFKEMGNGLGRVAACLCVGLCAPLLPLATTMTGVFVIAGSLSALSFWVSRQHARAAF